MIYEQQKTKPTTPQSQPYSSPQLQTKYSLESPTFSKSKSQSYQTYQVKYQQITEQQQQPRTNNPNPNQEQQQQAMILVRDLDSGISSCISPSQILLPPTLPTIPYKRKSQTWSDYWQQRQHYKHALIKLVNQNLPQKLQDYLKQNQNQIDINDYVYMDGWSLLHHAVSKKYYNVILALINIGCDVNKVTQSMKRTALHLAVLENNQDIVELLLTFGGDPNLVDIDFCTPVHYAAQFGYLDLIKIFLQNCQNINFGLKNNKKLSVFDCCKDIRIRNLIREYCEIHSLDIRSIMSQQRQIIDESSGKILFTRNRSDLIEKILDLSNHNQNQNNCKVVHVLSGGGGKNQNQTTQTLQNNNSVAVSTYPSLGSKINKDKLYKITQIAKQSLISYKDSLLSNTIQSLENYDIIRLLGSGSFGSVFLIRKKHSSKLFALKRLTKKTIIQNKLKKYAYAQKQILKTIRHPFVVHGYSFFQDPIYLYMVMDFCAGGDLQKQIRNNKFAQQKARKYCCEVVVALQQLHRHNYLFRDLKASNVLMDQFGHIKLSDFGLAKQSELSHSFLGSIAYLAPQMLVQTDNKPHTAAIDWYLLGVFVYEMVVGLPPFHNENRMVMFDQIKRQKPRIPSNLSPQCKDFILKTMSKKPSQRLGNRGASQVKKHPWFKNINWKQVLQKKLQVQIPQINHKQLRTRMYMQQQQFISQSSQTNNFKGWDSNENDKN